MTRERVQDLICQGYDVLMKGSPEKVKGDLNYLLANVDEEDTGLLVLEDLLYLDEQDLLWIKERS
ncbi:hypothetical protein [Sphingobacterium sp. CZ-2]|uniref:hypothetical protein n=1 Tax=Sphingobacterium sp. CZ-2 TaxID=2557994 RepID=UPI00107058D0|nr:hypothetical protein [Sphingobacterium sp. CZ-2]QBR13223.1 hypothetical protein E3D81_14030 [Sphingobacterium sp. CZ-2]